MLACVVLVCLSSGATSAGNCTTYHCYKGGPAEGLGQATDGCPLYSHPAHLADNRDCVLCMVCLKARIHEQLWDQPCAINLAYLSLRLLKL